ncbi:hypothetical protein EUTSA_v10003366mg, partial [Eutrema salsugineum]
VDQHHFEIEELAARSQPSEEIQRSWLLRPTVVKKQKKYLNMKILLCFTAIVIIISSHHNEPPPPGYNFTVALQTSLRFFNAQRSGRLPHNNNVSWRGDSCLHDGDYPRSSHMHLMLSWSVIEYTSAYQVSGELNHVKGLIKWGTDYFLNTFESRSNTIYELVSKISAVPNDHYCWMRPEDIDYQRHASVCFGDCPELAASMAAALASASIVFKDDVQYSKKLLHGARTVYRFADSMKDSTSMHWDDLIWGGAWMYYATGDLKYLDRVTSTTLASRVASSSGSHFSWDKKIVGAQLLLTRLRLFLSPGYPYEELLSLYHQQIGDIMCSYLPSFSNKTRGGLILFNNGDWQPLQYAANAAFLAALYSDYLHASDIPGWNCGPTFYATHDLRDFARSQIDYILGKNPQNMSYVVGFGERYPKHVHHRGASIPKNEKVSCKGGWKWRDSKQENPNTIEGAMVAGPDKHDGFHDVRANYNYTEPTLTGNAGLVTAVVAALSAEDKLKFDPNSMFSALWPSYPLSPPPPAPWTP